MPTGGKLIGALVFAALAYFLTDLVKALLPEGTQVGKFSPINALIGFVMGWTILGRGAGKTYRQAFGYGFTTLAATVFWCLLFWASMEMLDRSMRLFYDGPVEAIQEMAAIFLEYGREYVFKDREIMLTAVIGTIFVSWFTEFFARRWS